MLYSALSLYIFYRQITAIECEILVLNGTETYQYQEAAFGHKLERHGLKGQVIPINYLDALGREFGCWPVDSPTIQLKEKQVQKRNNHPRERTFGSYPMNTDLSSEPWIALVLRGGCSFAAKARQMQVSGAIAVIVGDNVQASDLLIMEATGDVSDIVIPSFFIQQWAYRDLRYLASEKAIHTQYVNTLKTTLGQGIHIQIAKNGYDVSLVDVIILAALCPILIFIGVYLLWTAGVQTLRKRRQRQTETAFLKQLPIQKFCIEELKGCESLTCAICLDDFVDDEELRYLPICKHQFHTSCVDPWLLTKSRTCPVCKRAVLADEPETEQTALLLPNE